MIHLMTFDNGRTFSPDGEVKLTPEQVAEHNATVAACELEHWATKPDHFSPAYYAFPSEDEHAQRTGPRTYRAEFFPFRNGATVTTWAGVTLGEIIYAKVYRHNMGGRMVAIRVRGTNGAAYYGRGSWDNGNVIGLRRIKA
jgi:hypothetical protein